MKISKLTNFPYASEDHVNVGKNNTVPVHYGTESL